mmetsp:Transcript_12456/g.12863  ORF Transcript_12456/g.12863 Transcript_12456/m.12863 type:complete len:114 (+) Transcript_12456:25-366(+)
MIIAFSLFATFLCTLSQEIPGRAIIWSPTSTSTTSTTIEPQYKTQTTSLNELKTIIENNLNSKELLITFCSNKEESKDFYTSNIFKNEILSSGDSIVIPNLYQSSSSSSSSSS